MMASKARLFGDDTALSATLVSDDPREQKCLGHHVHHFDHDFCQQECENSALRGNLAKLSQNEKMPPALVHTAPTPPRRSEPHDKLWGIGLSACDPESTNASTVMCATLATTSCKKDCGHIVPRGNIATFSQKDEIRLALEHIGERRLAEACHMINCGVPA